MFVIQKVLVHYKYRQGYSLNFFIDQVQMLGLV